MNGETSEGFEEEGESNKDKQDTQPARTLATEQGRVKLPSRDGPGSINYKSAGRNDQPDKRSTDSRRDALHAKVPVHSANWRLMKYTITSPANSPLVSPMNPPTRKDRSIMIQAQFGSVELIK